MGTNRRSRRRSAAKILNSTGDSKRRKLTTITTDDRLALSDDNQQLQSSIEFISTDDSVASENPVCHQNDDVSTANESIRSSPRDDVTVDITGDIVPPPPNTGLQPFSDDFTVPEICSYELMTLLDDAGCPRKTYEEVVCLLKKQQKRGFSVSEAHSREKLLSILKHKFHCPSIQSSFVNSCEVFSFPFVDMLQDLIDTSSSHLHKICPNSVADTKSDELWDTQWMQDTFTCPLYNDFNVETDMMLPIILYIDKTGTDTLQRYSLEPVLFTTAALSRESRENRQFWRHLGFIPSSKTVEDSKEALQFYHQCLGRILTGLKDAQQLKPLVKVTQPAGFTSYFRAHLPLMIILGDQLSNDHLCCHRKANSGGAGRVHRSCMCSYIATDDHTTSCEPIPKELFDEMIAFSTRTIEDVERIIDEEKVISDKSATKLLNSRTMKYARRQKKMFNVILGKPYTTHPVVSAFHDIDFGAWKSGVYDATFDDFMHSCEEGLMVSTLFDGLVASESEKVESLMTELLTPSRSSARSTFPRWRLQKGFSRQTLMTMAERVGSVFSLALGLHQPDISSIFREGHGRQRTKYEQFHKSNTPDKCVMYYEQYLHELKDDQCKHTVTHLHRHGFDVSLLETLDTFQINQLIFHASGIFENVSYPDSYPEFTTINGLYYDKGSNVRLNQKILNLALSAMKPKKEVFLQKHRLVPIEGVIPKHHLKKQKQKGEGSTCAFLGIKTASLIALLEYTLCYHSFCKYSSSLPNSIRDDFELVDFSGKSLLMYFQRMIYRGDGTIDSRTAKLHAQKRLGHNYRALGNVMHSCCEVGERLLKTEAKQISRTAQQRGNNIFERQTCSRILDRHLMNKMRFFLKKDGAGYVNSEKTGPQKRDKFSRQQPHFTLTRRNAEVKAIDRKGSELDPDDRTGHLHPFLVSKLLELEPDIDVFQVYNEVILRDGSYVRAFPNYRGEGQWYDFANIQWIDGDDQSYLLPAQCLTFYKKGEECMAIVQSVDIQSDGRVSGYRNSVLTSHYIMQCSKSGIPTLFSVSCGSIDCTILGFDHRKDNSILQFSRRSVMTVRPRNEWAYAWIIWNQLLKVKNKNRSISRPYVDLGSDDLIGKVRRLIQEKVKEQAMN